MTPRAAAGIITAFFVCGVSASVFRIPIQVSDRVEILEGVDREPSVAAAFVQGTHASTLLFVVVLLREPFEFFEEYQPAVRGDLKPLAARLTRYVIVDSDEMIFDLLEHRAVAGIGAVWDVRLPGPPHPPNAVVVGPAASRALEPRRPLLRLLRKEETLVHPAIFHLQSAI